METHSSILARRIPWAEEPGGLQSMGLQRVGHDCNDLTCTHTHTQTALRNSGLLIDSCIHSQTFKECFSSTHVVKE